MPREAAEADKEEGIGDIPTSLGIIFRGPYAELHSFLNEIEESIPPGCRILYIKYSPGGLMIRVEGQ